VDWRHVAVVPICVAGDRTLRHSVEVFQQKTSPVPLAPLARVAALMGLLAQLHAPVVYAQGRSAPSPASEPGPQSWVHESWTVKDGLPVNSINTLLQDRAGYIWAATFDGLVRFDGIRFTVFNSANSEELPSNRIIQLKEGRDGSLWLVTEQGHVVRFRDGRFTNVAFETRKPSPGLAAVFVDSMGGDTRRAVDGPT
jgi:two component regulator with propeller domain